MPQKKLLFCTHKVNKANIRRETRSGVEHIILTSFTLPPNIVMNGGLYPSEEVDKSFESLNRTPVTVEHPEIDGMFVSANDPEIDFDFRFGAFNENARKIDDGRIALDKVINVQKAMKTEKGKRLLDRIAEVEANEDARPIHTSVGVFLTPEETELATNERGQEYTWIARDMVFDHDAILLDTIGASTPEQGTGINVNKEQVKVEHYVCSTKKQRKVKALDRITNNELSFTEIEQKLWETINQGLKSEEFNWIVAVFDDTFIFETPSKEMFRSVYMVDDKDNLDIQDTRQPVERVVEFKNINPTETEEDSAMRDSIIAKLAALGITVNADISDADLQTEYEKALTANASKGDGGEEENNNIAEIVANAVSAAVEPLNSKIGELESTITANQDQELDALATQVVNSGQYPGMEAADVKGLGLDKAKALAANCGISHGIGSTMLNNSDGSEADTFKTNVADLPE